MLNDPDTLRAGPLWRRTTWPRTVPWIQVGPLLALAMAPTMVTFARDGRRFDSAILVWALVAASLVGFAYDEPPRAVLDATPVPAVHRIARRLAVITVVIALSGIVVMLLAWAVGGSLGSRSEVVTIAAVVAAVSAAAASVGHRRGSPTVSIGAVAVGPMVVLLASSFAQRYEWLPSLLTERHRGRWWWAVTVALVLVVANTRDPFRVGVARRHGSRRPTLARNLPP